MTEKTIYLAGGCFWGTEHFMAMVNGVVNTKDPTISNKPNSTTLAAMDEIRSGKARQNPPLDLSSVEAMEKSMGLESSDTQSELFG